MAYQVGRINGPALADNLQRESTDTFNFESGTLVIDGTNGIVSTTGALNTSASTAARAGLNIPEGLAPSAPVDGDIWVTAAGELNVRLNGVTVDVSAGGGGSPGIEYTATGNGSQTIFTVGDFTPGGFTYNSLVVYLDGILQSSSNYVTTDAVTITFNTAPANGVEVIVIADGSSLLQARSPGEYCPGYSSYSQISGTEFTIDLVNAVNLFYVGRRVKFVGPTGTLDFGVVASRDFDSTQANDTYVSMTMDGGDSIPATISNVCLVSSDTQWSPVAGDPFGGDAIRDIATGQISATQYWVAVGDNGKIRYSTNGGVSWSNGTSGITSGNLYTVVFDVVNQKFWAGGQDDSGDPWMASSTDGATWSSITIPFTTSTNDYIARIRYSQNQDYMIASNWDDSSGQFDNYVSNDEWVTDATRASNGPGPIIAANDTALPPQGYWWYGNGTQPFFYTGFSDSTASLTATLGVTVTALESDYNSLFANTILWAGEADGDITYLPVGGSSASDSVTFVNPVRGFSTSQLHARTVCVGDAGQIGYIDEASYGSADSWTSVANGFDPLANILAVEFNETDGVFIAVADNGEICRSSNGTN